MWHCCWLVVRVFHKLPIYLDFHQITIISRIYRGSVPKGENIQCDAVVWKKIPFYCCCTTRQANPVLRDEAIPSGEVYFIFFSLSLLCCKHDAVLLVGNLI